MFAFLFGGIISLLGQILIEVFKYFKFEAYFYNRVSDLVSCDIRNQYSISCKETGPIEPNERGGGTWECVIYNWSAYKADLKSIIIHYMDGTSRTIDKSTIQMLLKEPNLNNETYELNKELKQCSKQIQQWENRLGLLAKRSEVIAKQIGEKSIDY